MDCDLHKFLAIPFLSSHRDNLLSKAAEYVRCIQYSCNFDIPSSLVQSIQNEYNFSEKTTFQKMVNRECLTLVLRLLSFVNKMSYGWKSLSEKKLIVKRIVVAEFAWKSLVYLKWLNLLSYTRRNILQNCTFELTDIFQLVFKSFYCNTIFKTKNLPNVYVG